MWKEATWNVFTIILLTACVKVSDKKIKFHLIIKFNYFILILINYP